MSVIGVLFSFIIGGVVALFMICSSIMFTASLPMLILVWFIVLSCLILKMYVLTLFIVIVVIVLSFMIDDRKTKQNKEKMKTKLNRIRRK